jgi:pyruvate dehydrogenase E1 component beta subunit
VNGQKAPGKTLVEGVNEALCAELERDPSVFVMGEDVGVLGGVFRATSGLLERFPGRCFDTPLAEAGIVGTAVGLSLSGWRPVCEMQFDVFSYPALDQLITHVGRYRARSGGGAAMSIVVRMPYGGGVRGPDLHQDSPEAHYAHAAGLKVAIPSTPADAKGLLSAAIRDPDPVVVLEPKRLYRAPRGEVPEGDWVVPLGRARIAAAGEDVTLIAYGAMVAVALEAREELLREGASAEVVDLRTLVPLDEDAILASVGKTGRAVVVQEAPRTCGFAAEVVALLAEKAVFDLRGPVMRVTGYDVPYPCFGLEDAYLPSSRRVVAAAHRTGVE